MTDTQLIQDAANMGMLARQAITNEFPAMEVDPKICANVALLVERLTQTHGEAPAPEDTDAGERLAHAKEEGRREAIGEHAQEKADLLQRISELVAALPVGHELQVGVTDHPGQQAVLPGGPEQGGDEFKGPGQ